MNFKQAAVTAYHDSKRYLAKTRARRAAEFAREASAWFKGYFDTETVFAPKEPERATALLDGDVLIEAYGLYHNLSFRMQIHCAECGTENWALVHNLATIGDALSNPRTCVKCKSQNNASEAPQTWREKLADALQEAIYEFMPE